jgi:hypothetical protein
MICAFLFLIWFVVQVILYVKNDFFMRPIWQTINFILAFLAVISSSIVSMLSDDLISYAGLSYSMMTLLLVFWIYALLQFVIDMN